MKWPEEEQLGGIWRRKLVAFLRVNSLSSSLRAGDFTNGTLEKERDRESIMDEKAEQFESSQTHHPRMLFGGRRLRHFDADQRRPRREPPPCIPRMRRRRPKPCPPP